MSVKEDRLYLIKVIHVGRRDLGMEDDSYRLMLSNMPALEGVTSTAKLSVPNLRLVLDALFQRGFKIKPKGKSTGKPHNFSSPAMPESMTKIEALLADMGLSWSYADSIAKNMFKIEKCAWIRQPHQLKALIAALSVEHEKRSLLQSVIEQLGNQHLTLEDIEAKMSLRPGWKRRRSTLKMVLLTLADSNDEQ